MGCAARPSAAGCSSDSLQARLIAATTRRWSSADMRETAAAGPAVLRAFGVRQRPMLRQCRVRRLAVAAHDAAARGDARVEHRLHHRALIDSVGQAHAVALPVAACPRRLARARRSRRCRPAAAVVARRARAAPPRCPAGASTARGRPRPGCRSCGSCSRPSDTTRRSPGPSRGAPCRARSCRAGAAGGTVASHSALARGQHAAVAGGDDLARMEREAGDVAVRPADLAPTARPTGSRCRWRRPRPRSAGRPWRCASVTMAAQVAGHADLVHAQDRRVRGVIAASIRPGRC